MHQEDDPPAMSTEVGAQCGDIWAVPFSDTPEKIAIPLAAHWRLAAPDSRSNAKLREELVC